VKGNFHQEHGPQYAPGVGLVPFGAERLSEQSLHGDADRAAEPRQVAEVQKAQKGSSIWEWVRAAF
jgi:hypothetical protein